MALACSTAAPSGSLANAAVPAVPRGLIAYDTREGISVIRPNGSAGRLLIARRGARQPRWSPDGRLLVYQVHDPITQSPGRLTRIVVARSDGSRRRAVARGLDPQWMPNSRDVVFSVWANGREDVQLRVVNVATGRIRTLVSHGAPSSSVAFVGGFVVFRGSTLGDPAIPGIVVQRLDGSERRVLPWRVEQSREPQGLRWAPGGTVTVGCARRQHGRRDLRWWLPDICRVNLETGAFLRLTHDHVYETSAAWSPARDRMVVSSANGLYIAAPDGRRLRTLVDNGMGDLVPGPPSNSTWNGDWCCSRSAEALAGFSGGPHDWQP